MIGVEWHRVYVLVNGEEWVEPEYGTVPRVPRVGDCVDGLRVTRVSWKKSMDYAIIELRRS